MLLGLVFVTASRRLASPALGIALALGAWAVAAYVARVPWPLAGEQSFVPARLSVEFPGAPAPFVVGLLALAAGLLCLALVLPGRRARRAQAAASRVGYPGFVLATGVGFLLLLDLSAHASHGNRYLALYHQGHLWLAMLALSVLVFLRQPIGRGLAWSLAMAEGLAHAVGRRLGGAGTLALLLAIAALLYIAFGALLANKRQLTSEVGRLWLLLGAAWFFYMRGTPLAERLARSGTSLRSLARYVLPLAFVALVLLGAMVVTRDMGPLLIAGYAAGAFLAASIAMWAHLRFGSTTSAHALAVVLFVGWIVAITLALFQVGALDEVTAGRLENLAAPLASANDQLALITWFQQVAPPAGFGLGAVPWCGYGGSPGCPGVPAQIQSDYTFTAMVGAFGWAAAWALTVGCAVWLHRLVRHHGRVTRGEPQLVASAGRVANDEQGLLSWIAVAWVVLTLCQLAVTVAGNLAVIPLTGVTFPFVSFGMTSLVVNAGLLALCLSVNVPERA
jgi:cell division protein FtsW (lipid II flippase)